MLLVFFFFFSSRRRHTRFSRDWSSDVCSSDLAAGAPRASSTLHPRLTRKSAWRARSEERRVGKGVDLGGRRIIKKKKDKKIKLKVEQNMGQTESGNKIGVLH